MDLTFKGSELLREDVTNAVEGKAGNSAVLARILVSKVTRKELEAWRAILDP